MDLVVNVCIGLATGIYAGVVMARVMLFASVRQRARQVIRTVDFIQTASGWETLKPTVRVEELSDCASELFHLRHQEAGMKMMDLAREVSDALDRNMPDKARANLGERHGEWYERIRQLPPSWRACLLTGRL